MNFSRSFEFEVCPMLGKFDEKARLRRISVLAPSATPFAAQHGVQVRSRSILTDAAACFVATALGSLSPQALSLFDVAPTKPVAVNVDPESGKFTDRVLIGGLRPLSWEEGAKVAPAPAFTTAPALPDDAEEAAELHPKAGVTAAKPVRDAAPKKPERTPEVKAPEAPTAPAPVAMAASEPAAPEAKSEGQGSQSALASLTPSAVSAKVAEKVWSGAKSVGGAVSGGLSWLGY
jgi:hypothetical protein